VVGFICIKKISWSITLSSYTHVGLSIWPLPAAWNKTLPPTFLSEIPDTFCPLIYIDREASGFGCQTFSVSNLVIPFYRFLLFSSYLLLTVMIRYLHGCHVCILLHAICNHDFRIIAALHTPIGLVNKNYVGGCVQHFPDWPPRARTANGTALCHLVQ
jgi:hypothetical protein